MRKEVVGSPQIASGLNKCPYLFEQTATLDTECILAVPDKCLL